MNHNRENGQINNGGKRGKCSLSNHSVFFWQEALTFVVVLHLAYRDWRMSCARRSVKTAHLVVRTERVAQTRIVLVRT